MNPDDSGADNSNVISLAAYRAARAHDVAGIDDSAPEKEPAPILPRSAARAGKNDIAVVGMACNFPGADSLGAYWDLLQAGRQAITDGRPGPGHWAGIAGDPEACDMASRRGGFVECVYRFDGQLFGIPREVADTVDPLEAMLLETTWDALEDAGIHPDLLRGSRTGVYVGVGPSEYLDLPMAAKVRYRDLGTSGSRAAEQIGRVFGLKGPLVPVDLACASSLAAVHQAVKGIRGSRMDLAIVGGVNAVLSPAVSQELMQLGVLSPSGHCRPFDDAADGYVRGEGCGVVILKRLSKAEADGDRIWAVILGSAMGKSRRRDGVTAPDGRLQERVMRRSLDAAKLSPADVDYLEAHAIGSQVGDLAEVHAAASVYGSGRGGDRPLHIGSAKSNVGHLESAAGMTSLIKTVLSMYMRVIPPTLNCEIPNRNVEWDRIPVRLATEGTDWPAAEGRFPLAGVNAFGFSGAGAHVLIEGYGFHARGSRNIESAVWPMGEPRRITARLPRYLDRLGAAKVSTSGRAAHLLPLSGNTRNAVRDLARRYLDWFDDLGDAKSDELLADMAWSASAGRKMLPRRAGVVFANARELRRNLLEVSDGDGISLSKSAEKAGKTALVYRGINPKWFSLFGPLYRSEPSASAVLDRCDEVVWRERGVSLIDVIIGRTGPEISADDPAWVLPAICAIECAMAAPWATIGVRIDAVVGYGTGWLAAAHGAGSLSLEGVMHLAMAIGDERKAGAGRRNHDETKILKAVLGGFRMARPAVPLITGSTGQSVKSVRGLAAEYWLEDPHRPQKPLGFVDTMERDGFTLAMSVGLQAQRGDTLDPDLDYSDWTNEFFVQCVGELFQQGKIDSFDGLFLGESRRRISVPTYPFRQGRYWM